jgi:ATP-dependent exoDNAse (exonuclease V) beta subunit
MAGHWYLPDGSPRHTIVGKNGKERATTLRDARQENLLPSVTTALKVIWNQPLIDWFVRQGIEAALTADRRTGEEHDQFVKRIQFESTEKSRDSAEFGTKCHEHLERFNLDQSYEVPESEGEQMIQTVGFWKDYFRENIAAVRHAERTVGCVELGVAGTIDLEVERRDIGFCVSDYKTTSVNPKYGPTFYPSYGQQLALYARMIRINEGLSEDPPTVSHIIDSANPSPPHTKIYTREEQEHNLQVGLTCLRLWMLTGGGGGKPYIPEGCQLFS